MQTLETLKEKAEMLARSSPVQWQEFLRALGEYTLHHRDNLVVSPLTDIAVNQGRAQALSTLLKNLTDLKKKV